MDNYYDVVKSHPPTLMNYIYTYNLHIVPYIHYPVVKTLI